MLTPTRDQNERSEIPARDDDASTHLHRQLIGYIGLTLPFALIVVAGSRNAPGPDRWAILGSMSSYYYTGAIAVFVGLLVALALFLFTYQGYRNEHHFADRLTSIAAGFAALGVAFFPARAHVGVTTPDWWRPLTGVLHYSSALVLFGCFAVFSLWLFRLTGVNEKPTRDKKFRNRVYLFCGLMILLGMVWTAYNGVTKRPIFWPESVMLWFFAGSWLVKGYAHRTAANAVAGAAQSLRKAVKI